MKVSIITSCYNRAQTIQGAIESVLAQDYPDIEFIVVDGASKDGGATTGNKSKIMWIVLTFVEARIFLFVVFVNESGFLFYYPRITEKNINII